MQNQPNTPAWLTPRTVDHEINGETVTFREVSVESFMGLHELFGVISTAIMQLRRSPQTDAGLTQDSAKDGSTTFTQLPAGLDIIQHHDNQKVEAIHRLMVTLSNKKKQIASLLVESMGLDIAPEQLLRAGGPTFVACLEGFIKANEQLFRPFVRVERLVQWIHGEAGTGESQVVAEINGNLEKIKKMVNEAKQDGVSTPGVMRPTASPSSQEGDTMPDSFTD